MASQYDLPYTGPQVETLLAKISELESEMPSKTSDLTNDSGFITSTDVPTKTSDLNNDSGFITNAPVAAEAARAQAAEALLATIASLQAEITRATGVEGTLQDLIDGIAAKIPSAATEQNQLADKSYVNASIATASATFRGTYISLVALQSVAADENDYGYVISTDSVGNTIYNRYKYANSTWTFEYAIANPVFDSSQWAAINSAVTAELVAKLSALPDNATLTAALAAKQDVIDDLSSIRSKANSAYQKPSGGIPKTDLESGVQTSLGKADTALQQADIVDNVTTENATKPLSAKQGKVLNDNLSQLGQEVDELDGILTSPFGDINVENRRGGAILQPLATIENARLISWGGSSDAVYSGVNSQSVKVYAVSAGVTYTVPSYGDGTNSGRNAMTASNYINTLGVLSRIQVYGEAGVGSIQTLSITPTVDCFLYVSYVISIADNLPQYTKEEQCLGLKSGVSIKETLSGKKWAPFGDSFTQGATASTLPDGKYIGEKKVYPFFIGNRTGVEVLKPFFSNGRTLANPADGTFTNSATNPNSPGYYQNLPEDVDYITFYLGINDSHHAPGSTGGDGEDPTGEIPLGSINDATTATYYGAWNVVLSWLIENRPFAHIGIIVSNGCDSDNYRTAQIEIARKYGIPFIDLNGDDRTPFMLRATNNNIPSNIKLLRIQKQAVDYDGTKTGSANWHPNDDAHLFESFFIENFLRSL